ncbi:MAG: cupin domain-containing protein [Bacteroidales bacterium]|nr:cupin domain-containing protein [Bacteroidales bacterium]
MNEVLKKGVVLDFKRLIDYSEGSIISKLILNNKGGNITLFSFDKGQGLSEHSAPFDATIHLLEGEAEITLDGKPYKVKQGESFILPANHPHSAKATDRFKMLLVMIKGELN